MIKLSITKYLILTFVLLTIGGFLRFYNIEKSPYWMDEGYTINAVLSIQEKGSSLLDSGNYYSCPIYCYPTSWIAQILGDNPLSFRFLSVIAGILFIILIAYYTKKIFNSSISIISTVFITFSYWQIAWSHQARWYTLFSLLFWISILLFHKLINNENSKKKNIILLILLLIFTSLACLTHGLGYLLPLIFITWFSIDQIFIKKKWSWKKSIPIFVLGLVILLLLDSTIGIKLFKQLIEGIKLSYVLPYYLNFLIRNYWIFIIPLLYAVYSQRNEYKNTIYFLLFIFFSYLIPLSFLTNILHYRYLFHVTPIIIILGSIGIYYIYLDIKNQYIKKFFLPVVFILFFTVGGGLLMPKETYMLESDNFEKLGSRPHYAYTPQPDWNKAYDFIKANRTENDIVISSMPQFNKILLNEAGYWIKYSYLGLTEEKSDTTNNKEFYVGAETINNIDELKLITLNNKGYIIYDFMATEKINSEILDYIINNFDLVLYDEINSYSKVWVYKF